MLVSRRNVVVAFSVCVLTGFVCGQSAPSLPEYTSESQAYGAFKESDDALIREQAYDWTKEYVFKARLSVLYRVFSYLRQMAVQLDKGADFETFCIERIQENKPDVTSSAAIELSNWYVEQGDNEKALAVLTAQLEQEAVFSPAQTALIAKKTADVLVKEMNQYTEAVGVLSNAINTVSTEEVEAFVSLANAQAAIFQNNLADANAAEMLVREVIALGDQCPVSAYSTAVGQLALILSEKGDREGVVEVLMLLLKHSGPPSSGIAQKIIAAGATSADIEASLRLLRLRMGQMPSNASTYCAGVERLQPEVIEFLLALGRRDEAVRECRVLVFLASDKVYPQAVELAAQCLKRLDGNLGRANALLEFQSVDSGLAVKQRNVLLDFSSLDDAVRTESYTLLAVTEEPTDWNEWLLRSTYLLWLDRPVEAVDAAVEAFSLCPLSETALQTCAAAAVRPILVATRDSTAAQTVIDYMLFGDLGRDGKAGTEDDITDPFPEIRAKLALPIAADLAKQE